MVRCLPLIKFEWWAIQPMPVPIAMLSRSLVGAEREHQLRLKKWSDDLRSGVLQRSQLALAASEAVRVWGLDFHSPVGLAAGFDKQAEYLDVWTAAGFGFVEIGSVTPRPCEGNPPTRWVSVPEQGAMVNAIGCHSHGHAAVAKRLEEWRLREGNSLKVGVSLANQPGEPSIGDFVDGVRRFAPLADYLTLNISCPNVPEQSCYQANERSLERLLDAVWNTGAGHWQGGVPILLKVGLELTDRQCEMIAHHPADGLVIANTMHVLTGWPLKGGLSGRPIRGPALRSLFKFYRLTGGQVPLIGVGGIASATDACVRIKAGASLLQLHTALAFQGLKLVEDINRGILAAMRSDEYVRLSEVIGALHTQIDTLSEQALLAETVQNL